MVLLFVSLDEAEAVLAERFGLAAFRPGQREVIDALCTRGAALAVFPTGAGKSLCYQLPALLFEGVTLVVSPLIALMKDQIDYLRGAASRRRGWTRRSTLDEAREVDGAAARGQLRLLYVAPERFNNERFLEDLRRAAHRAVRGRRGALHLGVGPQLPARLPEAGRDRARVGAERVLALTATATPRWSKTSAPASTSRRDARSSPASIGRT